MLNRILFQPGPGQGPATARRAASIGAVITLAAVLGCAPAAEIANGVPVADPETTVRELARATTPEEPTRVTFDWSLDEPDLRVRGQGVIRMDAPDRLRLDLFGTRGESYLTAALVGEEMRFPGQVPGGLELPPPVLLWAALGVIRPPEAATVEAVESTETGETELTFRDPDGRTVRIRVSDIEDPRITSAQLIDGRHTVGTLDPTAGADGRPARSVYTDRPASRRLSLTFTGFEEVGPFSPEIWRPGAR